MFWLEDQAIETRPVAGCGKVNVICVPDAALTPVAGKPSISKSDASMFVTNSLNKAETDVSSAMVVPSGGSTRIRVGAVSSRVVTRPAITPKSLLVGSQL